MKELFIEDLRKIQGGTSIRFPCKCCLPTTLACCEETNGCDTCCPPTS